ncbi:hypothetical protein HK104_007068 [Borealophlyctis nickersoniae]|nr:hypothetical protein HK104_007068 [Borealophlyctis nickersoniae]
MLEGAVGGAEALADVTGSSAYERFTASQILKIVQMNHDAYSQTERISLVSSFAATLFLGSFAPIDASDASGMNLMDLRTRTWHEALLAVCAATDQDGAGGLRRRLGPVGDVLKVVGKVGNYMRERYGFREDCDITIFTGDNSASLASFCLDTSDVVVSLGTSDTLFFTVTGNPNPSTEGHVLVHPTRKDAYMVMVVYKNGSLARERIRDRYCVADWGKFGQIVEKGKHQGVKAGNVGFYFFDDEITPKCRAAVRRFENGKLVDEFPDEEINVRAVVEDRAMSMRMRAKMIGSKEGIRRRLVVTGGAALNKGILSVFAETFGADVVTSPMKGNAASLGSAYRARYGSLAKCEPRITFEQMMNSAGLGEMAVMVRWDSACADITEEDMATWAQLEEKVTSGIGDHSSL